MRSDQAQLSLSARTEDCGQCTEHTEKHEHRSDRKLCDTHYDGEYVFVHRRYVLAQTVYRNEYNYYSE